MDYNDLYILHMCNCSIKTLLDHFDQSARGVCHDF